MAKTLVVEPRDQLEKVPFLRGILTRSLQDAGLSFDEAYALATAVRDELSDTAEITTDQLHDSVLKHLTADFGAATAQRYETPATAPRMILVRDAAGRKTQFSREQHRQMLESSGLSYERSADVTRKIFDHLMKKGLSEVRSRYVGLLTFRYLRLTMGPRAARRYLVLVEFFRGERPLLLLIGGAPGCGKSAVATEIAHRLEIVRTQSTDQLREVMRMMTPERLLPVLHASSFEAWRGLPDGTGEDVELDDLVIDGYRAQAELLSVACEAVIQRAVNEHVSLILEGVHVQHSLLERIPKDSPVIVVPIMLAVLNPQRLRERIRGRGRQAEERRAERYLEHFDAIWRLQSFLLSEADRWRSPIVINDNKQLVIRDVLRIIVDSLSTEFTATPEQVFK